MRSATDTGDSPVTPCDQAGAAALAAALGDSPETVISVHLLRRGLCSAYVAGDPAHPQGAIIQPTQMLTGEPMAFGDDAKVLWDLLRHIDGWFCVNVTPRCAEALASILVEALGRPIRRLADIYYTLIQPALPTAHHPVRLLGPEDVTLLEAAPAEVQGPGFGSAGALLEEGVVAGAIIDGALVGIAHTSSLTPRHADIGVSTLAPWRGRGFATAAASLVAAQVQAAGRIPVWSTGEDNHASRRVAEKLGFREVGRREYLIPQP
jgi:GNAT superfamily N-acetyltransferase